MTYQTLCKKLLADSGIRFKFKDALTAFDSMDPVDALKDATLLVDYLSLKLSSMQGGVKLSANAQRLVNL